jgi:hypothetical protein
MALWATIDTEGQRKTDSLFAWVQEWYLKLEGPWGSVVGGRALDLFSRGATQNDFLYLHGYSLGFPGNIESNPNSPANGLIGFGVMAAFFSSGIAYATPSQYPLQNTIGVYDATPLPGGWEATRYPRFEDELTFDMTMRKLKLHLFGNGEYQSVYASGSNKHVNSYGVGYGGRAEYGNFHLGVAGHWGKGLGLFFALEPDSISVSSTTFELRTFDGYSAMAQYVAGRFDINAGWGISRVLAGVGFAQRCADRAVDHQRAQVPDGLRGRAGLPPAQLPALQPRLPARAGPVVRRGDLAGDGLSRRAPERERRQRRHDRHLVSARAIDIAST